MTTHLRKYIFMKINNFNYLLLLILILLPLKIGCEYTKNPDKQQLKKNINILKEVQQRGWLICGVSGDSQGFSDAQLNDIDVTRLDNEPTSSDFYDEVQKSIVGFDVDICKAIAAAIFDDPEAVRYRLLDTKERFEEISSREIDVLSRNTTWTVERDVSIKLEFAPVVFFDGQGVLVRKDSGIQSLNDLDGKTVCVETETTTEKNIEDEIKKRGINYEIKRIQFQKDVYKQYEAGQCQAVTSDKSQLAAKLNELKKPDAHVILTETISKEPLAPAVIDSDLEWIEIVRWVVFALIEAEELGITQSNLEQMKNSTDPRIRRFLELDASEDSIGSRLNLSPGYTQRIIKHVGNYGEIYERNLGPNSSTPIERGLNNLWNNPEERGLMYSPPFQ